MCEAAGGDGGGVEEGVCVVGEGDGKEGILGVDVRKLLVFFTL